MSSDTGTQVQGAITITFDDKGNINIEGQGVSFAQFYAAAAILHEMARQQHVESSLQQRMGAAQKGIVVPPPGSVPNL